MNKTTIEEYLRQAKEQIENTVHHCRYFHRRTLDEITSPDDVRQITPQDPDVIFCPSLGIEDMDGNPIHVGDIVCIRAYRCNYTSMNTLKRKNINHRSVDLHAFVLNQWGTLRYDPAQIQHLKQPQGRERTKQVVACDYNILEPYWCGSRFKVVGHIYNDPDLLTKWREDV